MLDGGLSWRNTSAVNCMFAISCQASMDRSSLLLFLKTQYRDNFGSEYRERKYHIQPNLTRTNIKLARQLNKILY